MIEGGLTRGVINTQTGRAKRFLKWAAENELVPPDVYQGLQTVSGLRRGRSQAPESEAVKPVPDEYMDAVLKHVNRHVAAMIQLQRFTGMRPGEVIMMRACDLIRPRIGRLLSGGRLAARYATCTPDSGLIRHTKKPWREYAAELQAKVTEVKTGSPWSYGKTPEWATESYRLALSHTYDVPKDGKLGQAYFDRNIPIVNERLWQ